MSPHDPLPLVLGLLLLEDQLNEELLQLLIAVVYAELLKTAQQRKKKKERGTLTRQPQQPQGHLLRGRPNLLLSKISKP